MGKLSLAFALVALLAMSALASVAQARIAVTTTVAKDRPPKVAASRGPLSRFLVDFQGKLYRPDRTEKPGTLARGTAMCHSIVC
jgi:hypothetical protein